MYYFPILRPVTITIHRRTIIFNKIQLHFFLLNTFVYENKMQRQAEVRVQKIALWLGNKEAI